MYMHFMPIEEDYPNGTPTTEDKNAVRKRLQTLAIPGWEDLVADFKNDCGNQERLHNIVLLFAPNVRSITYFDDKRRFTPVPKWVNTISKAVEGAFGETQRFSNLQSVKIDVVSTTFIKYAPLFHVQSLRRIHLRGTNEIEVDEDDYNPNDDAREFQSLIPPACNNV
jgi:hypothetical protein